MGLGAGIGRGIETYGNATANSPQPAVQFTPEVQQFTESPPVIDELSPYDTSGPDG